MAHKRGSQPRGAQAPALEIGDRTMTTAAPASTPAAPDAQAAPRPAAERRGAYGFADLVPADLEERTLATEIWLDGICKAAWATKEAMRIGAMVATHVRDGVPQPMILKDIESILSIPKEEVNRMFKMMKLFGVYEKYDLDGPGNIVLSLRLSAIQKLAVRETKQRLDALSGTARLEQRSPPHAVVPPAGPTEPAPPPAVTLPPPDAGGGPLAARMSNLQQKLRAGADKP